MSMYDAADGKGGDSVPAVVSVSVGKMDTLRATSRLLAAIKANDAAAADDALKEWMAACGLYDTDEGSEGE